MTSYGRQIKKVAGITLIVCVTLIGLAASPASIADYTVTYTFFDEYGDIQIADGGTVIGYYDTEAQTCNCADYFWV